MLDESVDQTVEDRVGDGGFNERTSNSAANRYDGPWNLDTAVHVSKTTPYKARRGPMRSRRDSHVLASGSILVVPVRDYPDTIDKVVEGLKADWPLPASVDAGHRLVRASRAIAS